VADAPLGPGRADDGAQPVSLEPFGPEVFRERRARLMSRMKGGLAVVLSAPTVDWETEARQDADFLYLTGLADEAGAALVLAPQDPAPEMLFLKMAVPERDRWTGYRQALPSRALEERTGLARIERMDFFPATLSALAYRWRDLHFFGPLVGYSTDAPRVLDIYGKTSARVPGARQKDSVGMLLALRLVKEPRELSAIQQAIAISTGGHLEAMRRVRPGMREWELKRIVEDAFRAGGSRRLAYGSIVGAGPDGCVLHYPNDDRVVADGELVLIDAGAEYQHYASDITRTFPANGHFTAEQRQIYDVVLRAADAAIARVRPGVTLEELNQVAQKVIADAGYYDYYIHHIGHHVGLEVHDGGSWTTTATLPLAEGAVITIEPGIYLPGRRLGVRIEDMVLVTHGGSRLLSAALPRSAPDIEHLMQEARR
jgi:Xaa-Pro aminopeptidase